MPSFGSNMWDEPQTFAPRSVAQVFFNMTCSKKPPSNHFLEDFRSTYHFKTRRRFTYGFCNVRKT